MYLGGCVACVFFGECWGVGVYVRGLRGGWCSGWEDFSATALLELKLINIIIFIYIYYFYGYDQDTAVLIIIKYYRRHPKTPRLAIQVHLSCL